MHTVHPSSPPTCDARCASSASVVTGSAARTACDARQRGSTSVSTGWRGWRCSASNAGMVVRFEMARVRVDLLDGHGAPGGLDHERGDRVGDEERRPVGPRARPRGRSRPDRAARIRSVTTSTAAGGGRRPLEGEAHEVHAGERVGEAARIEGRVDRRVAGGDTGLVHAVLDPPHPRRPRAEERRGSRPPPGSRGRWRGCAASRRGGCHSTTCGSSGGRSLFLANRVTPSAVAGPSAHRTSHTGAPSILRRNSADATFATQKRRVSEPGPCLGEGGRGGSTRSRRSATGRR